MSQWSPIIDLQDREGRLRFVASLESEAFQPATQTSKIVGVLVLDREGDATDLELLVGQLGGKRWADIGDILKPGSGLVVTFNAIQADHNQQVARALKQYQVKLAGEAAPGVTRDQFACTTCCDLGFVKRIDFDTVPVRELRDPCPASGCEARERWLAQTATERMTAEHADNQRTAQQDVDDFGVGFEVDGHRVAPDRVRVFTPRTRRD